MLTARSAGSSDGQKLRYDSTKPHSSQEQLAYTSVLPVNLNKIYFRDLKLYFCLWYNASMENYNYIRNNLEELEQEIRSLSERYGNTVTLVAVTKSGSDEELVALVKAGACHIGENRPGEVKRRGELLRNIGLTPALHEIGNLQRNKVKYIIDSVSLIHSLDSEALAAEIDKQAGRVGRRVPVLIEINSAGEGSKGGIAPECAEEFFLSLRKYENLIVSGIMTMGPVCDDPEDIRPYFRLTKKIFDSIRDTYGFEGVPTLSMGMSDSYRVAIEEGATLVRVGRKLFEKPKGDQ